jgi:hypothetical protein
MLHLVGCTLELRSVFGWKWKHILKFSQSYFFTEQIYSKRVKM